MTTNEYFRNTLLLTPLDIDHDNKLGKFTALRACKQPWVHITFTHTYAPVDNPV